MKKEPQNNLLDAIHEIEKSNPSFNKKGVEIVDIMTFCDDPNYLDLPTSNFDLYMSQRVILKTFYIGTRGNENLKLSKEEWEWLYSHEKDEERDGIIFKKNVREVIEKLLKNEKDPDFKGFKELNLVLGRRGSKTILASVISAYEIYKLLVIGGGDPHKFYGLPYDDEIAVINVALSQEQARRLFGQVQARIRNAPFFKGRVSNETTTEIRFYTDRDIKKKTQVTNLSVKGSIFILCGHSNPDTLRGYSTILILFDELAFYDDTGKVTGQYFYSTLKPSLSKFKKYGDGRLVEISSPSTMSGIFYDIHHRAKEDPSILSYQLPTWCSNPEITYDSLSNDRERNPDSFAVEYGAQWSKSGIYGNYFEVGLVERCIRTDISPHMRQMPGFSYYLHVDPAKNGARYVAVLVAKERYANIMGHRRIRVHFANMWVWDPQPGIGLLFNEIDKEMIQICARFHPMAVSYDQYNSIHSLQLLKSHGINTIQTSYNRAFKNKIYQNLKDLMSYHPHPELWLYDEPRLILEMKALKYRPTMRGVSLVVDRHGEVRTDDVVDCLAGATAMASESLRMALPEPVVVRTGFI